MINDRDNTRATLGQDIIGWIQTECLVPEGAWARKRVKLATWQQKEILRIYDNRAVTRRAILSFGRKNGKTTLAACLLLAHLAGPAAIPNSQLYSAAQSRDQAAILFHLAAKMVRMNPVLDNAIVIRDGSKTLQCPKLGTIYRALSAEASTSYGLSPIFLIHDELGQVRGPRSELYEALETATGAQLRPLTLIISTQAPSDNDLLSILIDDALAGNDPRVICSLYTAPLELDPFDVKTIRLANPALRNFLNDQEVLAMAADAKRMPAREAAYRNLVLNQRVEASSPFIAPMQWKACAGEPLDLIGRDVFAGLDLSATKDLTALVLAYVDPTDGLWHVRPTFWLPSEGLADKALADRVPYDLYEAKGYLIATPGSSVSYEFVSHHLRWVFAHHHVRKLGFDAWNMQHLNPWLLSAGFSEQLIKDTFVPFRQGFQSMSPALRDLESLILDKKLRHGDHPVLSMCMMNAVIEKDAAGNRKLSKKRSAGRIDGAVALTMAIGVAPKLAAKIDIDALIG